MKKSDMVHKISERLRKHKALFIGYKKGSIDLRCITDNLSIYLMKEIEESGMLPPTIFGFGAIPIHKWEKEDE